MNTFTSQQPLLDLKESELKKLGVQNSKDRSLLMGSLTNYRIVRHEAKSGKATLRGGRGEGMNYLLYYIHVPLKLLLFMITSEIIYAPLLF